MGVQANNIGVLRTQFIEGRSLQGKGLGAGQHRLVPSTPSLIHLSPTLAPRAGWAEGRAGAWAQVPTSLRSRSPKLVREVQRLVPQAQVLVSVEATLAPGPRSPDLLPENRPDLRVGGTERDQLLLWMEHLL